MNRERFTAERMARLPCHRGHEASIFDKVEKRLFFNPPVFIVCGGKKSGKVIRFNAFDFFVKGRELSSRA